MSVRHSNNYVVHKVNRFTIVVYEQNICVDCLIKQCRKQYICTNVNILTLIIFVYVRMGQSNRKAMNRNWSHQKANPALKTKTGNK